MKVHSITAGKRIQRDLTKGTNDAKPQGLLVGQQIIADSSASYIREGTVTKCIDNFHEKRKARRFVPGFSVMQIPS